MIEESKGQFDEAGYRRQLSGAETTVPELTSPDLDRERRLARETPNLKPREQPSGNRTAPPGHRPPKKIVPIHPTT